ncbi:polymer-forming cytoskeletal protein [Paenibacillus rhizovicinus]|uniref:Polymer-forming cytoskeletal protein n=1 Tax=Paenibacillus rhizovicinus TaxID=2704463 RepID=A0A6C0P0S7_9BACL|nr:polymer-forming cytoskeletal protein [Paenibacillus rhizovicinus]QHW31503.1 polymer-forming cytoskeletal protein [Paenibacillus rhizovicinus]
MFKFWKKDKISTLLTDTFIGEGTIIEGAIRSAGSVRVEGQLRGDLFAEGDVVLGESAFAISNITARNVVLAGQVTGNVRISGKLTIASTGKLYGDMDAATLAIDEGGIFQGNSAMDMGEPVVSPIERRAGRDRRAAADPDWKGEERRSGIDRRDKEAQSSLLMKKISFRASEKNNAADASSDDAELQAAGGSPTVSADPLRENGRAFMQNMNAGSRRSEGLSEDERAALGVPGQATSQAPQQMAVAMAEVAAAASASAEVTGESGELAGDSAAAGTGDALHADVAAPSGEVHDDDVLHLASSAVQGVEEAAVSSGEEAAGEVEVEASWSEDASGEVEAAGSEDDSLSEDADGVATMAAALGDDTVGSAPGSEGASDLEVEILVSEDASGEAEVEVLVNGASTVDAAEASSAAIVSEAAAGGNEAFGWTVFEPLKDRHVESDSAQETNAVSGLDAAVATEAVPIPAGFVDEHSRQPVQTPSSAYAFGFQDRANSYGNGNGEQAKPTEESSGSKSTTNRKDEEAAALLRNW